MGKKKNNECNCNSRETVDTALAQAEILDNNCLCEKTCQDEMRQILQQECGVDNAFINGEMNEIRFAKKPRKRAAEFSVDEMVADSLENGSIEYRNTCDYAMITPENHCSSDDDLFCPKNS